MPLSSLVLINVLAETTAKLRVFAVFYYRYEDARQRGRKRYGAESRSYRFYHFR
jgi:hypothetical protein